MFELFVFCGAMSVPILKNWHTYQTGHSKNDAKSADMVASPPPDDDNDEFDEDDAFWSLRFILDILPDIILFCMCGACQSSVTVRLIQWTHCSLHSKWL